MSAASRLSLALIASLTLAVLASTAGAAAPQRHSGLLVALDPGAQSITIEEMGPWTGPRTSPIKRSFEVPPATTVEVTRRSHAGSPEGWPGGFAESALAISELCAGNYVTVVADHRDDRWLARSITVVRSGDH